MRRPSLLICLLLAACSREAPLESPPTKEAPTAPAEPWIALSDPALSALREIFGDSARGSYYFAREVDLNQDGQDEIVAYIAGPMVCGTGGCNTIVLTAGPEGYRVVGDISVTHPPIRAATSVSHGWRDLIVEVSGGGGPSGPVRLRFAGDQYADDASGDEAERLAEVPADATVLIRPFGSLQEGRLLYDAPPAG